MLNKRSLLVHKNEANLSHHRVTNKMPECSTVNLQAIMVAIEKKKTLT